MSPKYIARILAPPLLLLTCLPLAHAEFPRPGFYALLCGRQFFAKTARAAMQRCISAEQRGRFRGERQCVCATRADILQFTPTTQPAFFLAGEYHAGDTLEKATAACLAKHNAPGETRGTSSALGEVPCTAVEKVYGPYARKLHLPSNETNDFDDSREFRFLSTSGRWVDARGKPPCFVAGTPIATPSGNKPIEALVPGDPVRSWSAPEGTVITARVTAVKTRTTTSVLELRLADGRSVRLTANHPLNSPSRAAWLPAGELRVGDTLATDGGAGLQAVPISEIHVAPAAAPDAAITVYDVTVEPTHSYFANGILAHNY